MNIVRFGSQLINLDRVFSVSHSEDARDDERDTRDWLRENFCFYSEANESVTYLAIRSDDPGFEEFKQWFFSRPDGIPHNDSYSLSSEERLISDKDLDTYWKEKGWYIKCHPESDDLWIDDNDTLEDPLTMVLAGPFNTRKEAEEELVELLLK